MDDTERLIREGFAASNGSEPGLDDVLTRPRPRLRVRRATLAAAALVVAGATGFGLTRSERHEPSVSSLAPAESTDWLLRSPDPAWFNAEGG